VLGRDGFGYCDELDLVRLAPSTLRGMSDASEDLVVVPAQRL
jgi:hypothetical protein